MPLYEFEGKRPTVDPTAFIAPTATLIGDVTVEAGASVWYGVVIRADICAVVIRKDANVQDNSVLHAQDEVVLEVGEGATIGHGCVVHGAVIERHGLVGNGSVMLDGTRLGEGSLLAAGALLTPGTEIPAGVVAAGAPAKVRGDIAGTPAETWVQLNPTYYPELARRHRDTVRLVD